MNRLAPNHIVVPRRTRRRFYGHGIPKVDSDNLAGRLIVVEGADGSGRSTQIAMLVEDVMDALEAQFEKEIPTSAIGEGVMQRLRHVDQVAYVRFASVYKEFRDVAEFVDEISALSKQKRPPAE